MADEPAKLASDGDIEEMAGALGFADSHAEGFWEAFAQAVADQRAAAQEKADNEHAQQLQQAWADASKYGRRLEETSGRITLFTEFIPPKDGDIVDGEVLARIGEEVTNPDGTKTVSTGYYKFGEKVAVIVSVIKDDVETVTKVYAYDPSSVDVKVGDERPVPPPGSFAGGLKPHTIDPKADGSMGKASGNQPDEKPAGETVVSDKADSGAEGRRWVFDPIKLPDGRVIVPFLEDKPPSGAAGDLPYRSGYDIHLPGQDDAFARITAYFDIEGKLAGVTGSVIQGAGTPEGKDTIVAVEELIQGSLGFKKGDTRPLPGDLGKDRDSSTWDPPKSSTGTSSDAPGSDPSTPERDRPETSDDEEDEKDETPAPASESQQQSNIKWASESYTSPEGDKYTAYEITNADGSKTTGTQKEAKDGTKTCVNRDDQKTDCPAGLTDEPTCHVDCERLAMLTAFFSCASGPAGAECGQAPEGLRPDPLTASNCPGADGGKTTGSTATVYTKGPVSSYYSGCSYADKPGGPVDYGDPTNPNGDQPVDASQIGRLGNDGVTDPTGEPEATLEGGIKLDTYGTLRDPANPPGTADEAPSPGIPNTGEDERTIP